MGQRSQVADRHGRHGEGVGLQRAASLGRQTVLAEAAAGGDRVQHDHRAAMPPCAHDLGCRGDRPQIEDAGPGRYEHQISEAGDLCRVGLHARPRVHDHQIDTIPLRDPQHLWHAPRLALDELRAVGLPHPPPVAHTALWIGVHQQHTMASLGREDGEVHGQGGLSGATLAGEHGDGAHVE